MSSSVPAYRNVRISRDKFPTGSLSSGSDESGVCRESWERRTILHRQPLCRDDELNRPTHVFEPMFGPPALGRSLGRRVRVVAVARVICTITVLVAACLVIIVVGVMFRWVHQVIWVVSLHATHGELR